jgi:peptidoglycan-associated lipoprotein
MPVRHLLLIGAGALALAGCNPVTFNSEAGSQLDTGTFGQAVAYNSDVQTGQRSAMTQLGTRFANEVPSTVTFAFDSAALDAEARAALDRQAHWIRQFPEVRFRVYGHTDLVGSHAYNQRLGLRRANAVVNYLVSRGVSRSRLEAVVSYGKTQPVIPTPAPEERNRRTVTEVNGFVQSHPMVHNGKYMQVVFREYVGTAVRPLPPVSGGTGGFATGG